MSLRQRKTRRHHQVGGDIDMNWLIDNGLPIMMTRPTYMALPQTTKMMLVNAIFQNPIPTQPQGSYYRNEQIVQVPTAMHFDGLLRQPNYSMNLGSMEYTEDDPYAEYYAELDSAPPANPQPGDAEDALANPQDLYDAMFSDSSSDDGSPPPTGHTAPAA
jgi:hypothetical protein